MRGSVSEALTTRILDAYDAWIRGDMEPARELMEPDLEVHPAREFPDSLPYVGRERFLSRSAEQFAAFEEVDGEVEALEHAGDDTLLIVMRLRARLPGSHASVEQRLAHVWTLRDGRAVRWQAFYDEAEARRVAGLAA